MKTLFIYPTKRAQGPSTFYYGLAEMKKLGRDVFYATPNLVVKKIIKLVFLPVELFFYRKYKMSLHFDEVYGQILSILKAEKIISTVDSLSIPLLMMKKIGILRNKIIICLSVDLINRIEENGKTEGFIKKLYEGSDRIIVFSKSEDNLFRKKWHLKQIKYVQFGIDYKYFQDIKFKKTRDVILTIGRDRSRDYDFLFDLARAAPSDKFMVICEQKNVINKIIPKNVKLMFNLPYWRIKKIYEQTYVFLLPLNETHRASGQVAFLESAATGLPVICTNVSSIADNYSFSTKDGVYLIPREKGKWLKLIYNIKNRPVLFKRSVADMRNLIDAYKL